MATVPYHGVVTLFPRMNEDEFRDLVEDIARHGLREPIWRYDGKIIDGRHRYEACLHANIEPRFREWDGQGSLTEFVLSLNLKRRQLLPSQLAMIAAMSLPLLEEEARDRMKSGTLVPPGTRGKATEKAAAATGVSARSVARAKVIHEQAIPEVREAVQGGKMTVNRGAAIARKSHDEQRESLKEQVREARRAGDDEDARDCADRWGKLLEKVSRQITQSGFSWGKFPGAIEKARDALGVATVNLLGGK